MILNYDDYNVNMRLTTKYQVYQLCKSIVQQVSDHFDNINDYIQLIGY